MRRVKKVRERVPDDTGELQEVRPEGSSAKAPLQVKVVSVDGRRYIVCAHSEGREEGSRRSRGYPGFL
jgi:hypothetical protein